MKDILKRLPANTRLFRRVSSWLAVFILISVSILAVTVMDRAEERYALRRDFSFNRVTSQSEESTRVLKALPHPVHAYALFTPGNEDQALIGLLNRFAAVTPNFTYSIENLLTNPMLVNTLSSSLNDQEVTADSLILHCEATGRTRVLRGVDYLAQSFDSAQQAILLSGLMYEESIMEALVYVTMDQVPRVFILEGHGEIAKAETVTLESLLADNHFEVKRLNLLSDDSLKPSDLLLVLSPQIDLADEELQKLTAFTGDGGALLITSDYSDPDRLPLFDALYRSLGFVRLPGIVVADRDDNAAYTQSQIILTPYFEMTEPTAPLIGAGQTRLILPGARAFNMASIDNRQQVTPILTSGLAYIKQIKGDEVSLEPEEGDESGQFSLALLSDVAHGNGTHSRALILGNSSMLLDSYLYETTYATQFLLHMANHLMARDPIDLNIQPRQLVRPPLTMDNPLIPAAVIVLLPLLPLFLALPYLLRRKRR